MARMSNLTANNKALTSIILPRRPLQLRCPSFRPFSVDSSLRRCGYKHSEADFNLADCERVIGPGFGETSPEAPELCIVEE